MSAKDESKEYAEFIAALENDAAAYRELAAELKTNYLAEKEIDEKLKRIDKHLDAETEESVQVAFEELLQLFADVNVDQ